MGDGLLTWGVPCWACARCAGVLLRRRGCAWHTSRLLPPPLQNRTAAPTACWDEHPAGVSIQPAATAAPSTSSPAASATPAPSPAPAAASSALHQPITIAAEPVSAAAAATASDAAACPPVRVLSAPEAAAADAGAPAPAADGHHQPAAISMAAAPRAAFTPVAIMLPRLQLPSFMQPLAQAGHQQQLPGSSLHGSPEAAAADVAGLGDRTAGTCPLPSGMPPDAAPLQGPATAAGQLLLLLPPHLADAAQPFPPHHLLAVAAEAPGAAAADEPSSAAAQHGPSSAADSPLTPGHQHQGPAPPGMEAPAAALPPTAAAAGLRGCKRARHSGGEQVARCVLCLVSAGAAGTRVGRELHDAASLQLPAACPSLQVAPLRVAALPCSHLVLCQACTDWVLAQGRHRCLYCSQVGSGGGGGGRAGREPSHGEGGRASERAVLCHGGEACACRCCLTPDLVGLQVVTAYQVVDGD
jgi:hypothetical protein